MTRKCLVCGKPYESNKASAKFCGPTCRSRNHRGAGPTKPVPGTTKRSNPVGAAPAAAPAPAAASVPVDAAGVGVISSVVNELTAADRLNSALGQTALRLAVRLETSTIDTGAGLAALSKELRAVMVQALAQSEADVDPIDELKARRDTKRRAG